MLKRLRPGGSGVEYPSFLKTAGESPGGVLVIGDSWANIAGTEVGLAEALGRRASIWGYSGRTSQQIAAQLAAGDAATLSAQLGRLDAVVFLVGVNDLFLHVGAGAYAQGVESLRGIGREMAAAVYVVEVPPVNMRATSGWWGAWCKRRLFRLIHDGGRRDPMARYRSAVNAEITLGTLLPAFDGHEHLYSPDGLHLQVSQYPALGRHIGRELARLNPALIGADGQQMA